MKMKVKIISLMLVFSLMFIFLPLSNNNIVATPATEDFKIRFGDYTDQTPIIITHDDNFSLYPITGTGSALDPYRIENFNITSVTEETAISISHTTKYFIIKNCYLRPTTTGIYLYNVTQGSAQIVDNIIEGIAVDSGTGIFVKSTNSTFIANNTYSKPLAHSGAIDLEYAHHSVIFNNTALDVSGSYKTSFLPVFRSISVTITNNTGNRLAFGISFYEGSNAIVANNSFSDCLNTAISIYTCPDSVFDNNYLEDCGYIAMEIYDSPSNVTNNVVINKGFRISNSDNSLYRLYRVENNKVNNKEFGYFIDTPDLILDSGTYSQIHALNCSNMVIENINTNDIASVITLRECSNPSISHCVFSYSVYSPILLANCSTPEVSYNLFSNCEQGLGLYYSDFANIYNNTFIYQFFEALMVDYSHNASITYNLFQDGNTGVWINSESHNNSVHHNTFQYSSAYDEGKNNIWYDPVAQQGNYWWDYSGTGNYTIPGSSRSNDTYPLLVPPVNIIPEFKLDSYFSFLLVLMPLLVVIPYIRKRKK
ncbi:MAG: right-handed parallel beta-helix repeat-containing protein [Candidatus Heimdallarchaeota archaeon]|nr:right-handed parallel beta-helix repeat-containing protein [Candidatus Heimdallarchaeota archaeon]MCK4876562.1 right-handed parallel beta-helix repeat-containing protein [Candidatus Heimdallarchaeota archaeon]